MYVVRFAHLYGIRPWEVGDLTRGQYRAFRAAADEWTKEQRLSGG